MHTHLTCPHCGQALTAEGTYLRCVTHGLFFRYGPRRLLAAPMPVERHEHLLPWQTLNDETPRALSLPATAATASTK